MFQPRHTTVRISLRPRVRFFHFPRFSSSPGESFLDETGEILGALADLGRLYIGVVSIGIRLSAFPSAQRVRPSSLLEIISPAREMRPA